MKRKLPRISNTRWNFRSRLVQVVYDNKESLIECFREIERTSENDIVISQARSLRLKLEQNNFQFWLAVFYYIMPQADILYNQLQKRTTDVTEIKGAVSNFEAAIRKIRDTYIDEIANDQDELPEPRKRQCRDSELPTSVAAKEICDVIILHVRERFSFNKHLSQRTFLWQRTFTNTKNNFRMGL